jgi:glycosyltransferase involved in cell wall biosynthesis
MDNSGPIKPFVSVVMPLYNKEREVYRAINSVLSQTVREFELIVVNDGSTDKGLEVLRAFDDQRIRIFDQTNQGVSAARNKGIAEAKTELIAFLDADDEWKPDFLETIVHLKNNFPDCSVFATSYLYSLPDGRTRPTGLRGLPRDFHEGILPDYFALAATSDPPLCSSAVAVTQNAIASVGDFPAEITSGEDLLTWARLAARYDIAYSTKNCAVFWMPVTLSDRPNRIPQDPDIVGLELQNLLEYVGSKKTSLKNYMALWHKMRANIFMRIGARKRAIQEINRAVQLAGTNSHLVALAFLSILPGKSGSSLYHLSRRLRRKHFSD